MLILVAIFSLLFLVLALRHLDWALLLIIAALPSYLIRFNLLGLPLTLLEVMILIAFLVWLVKEFFPQMKAWSKNWGKQIKYPFSWEIILVVLLAYFAVLYPNFLNLNPGALGIWKAYFFEPFLLYILLFNVFKEKKDWTKILWALLVSAAVVSLLAIFQKITGLFIANPLWQDAETRRAVSFFGYPNAVGLYLGPLVLVFVGWLVSLPWNDWREQLNTKIAIAVTIALSLSTIYFARSIGALVAIVVSSLIFVLFANKKLRLWGGTLLVVSIALLFIIAPSRNFVINKLSFQDLSGQIRKQQWKETLLMLGNGHIFSGVGLDNYQTAVAPYHQPGLFFNRDRLDNFDDQLHNSEALRDKYWQPVEIYLYPHNIFLNFWSELGLLGALLFVWIMLKYLFLAIRLVFRFNREKKSDQYLTLGLFTAMTVVIIHGLVDVPYFKNDLALLFWLLVAFVGYLNLNYNLKRQEK